MKMFRGLSNWIGMDMGSSQVRIYRENKVILAEASTVAVDVIHRDRTRFGKDHFIFPVDTDLGRAHVHTDPVR